MPVGMRSGRPSTPSQATRQLLNTPPSRTAPGQSHTPEQRPQNTPNPQNAPQTLPQPPLAEQGQPSAENGQPSAGRGQPADEGDLPGADRQMVAARAQPSAAEGQPSAKRARIDRGPRSPEGPGPRRRCAQLTGLGQDKTGSSDQPEDKASSSFQLGCSDVWLSSSRLALYMPASGFLASCCMSSCHLDRTAARCCQAAHTCFTLSRAEAWVAGHDADCIDCTTQLSAHAGPVSSA